MPDDEILLRHYESEDVVEVPLVLRYDRRANCGYIRLVGDDADVVIDHCTGDPEGWVILDIDQRGKRDYLAGIEVESGPRVLPPSLLQRIAEAPTSV